MTNKSGHKLGLLVFAALLSSIFVWIGLFANSPRVATEQTWISGTLVEWSETGGGRGLGLRFSLKEIAADLRVDPAIYREVLGERRPDGFAPGAAVGALVSRLELANPQHPLLRPDLSIIWVNGIKVNGREIFGFKAVQDWEQTNQLWGYGLAAAAMAFFSWAVWHWIHTPRQFESVSSPAPRAPCEWKPEA